jgi:hypothetical protein
LSFARSLLALTLSACGGASVPPPVTAPTNAERERQQIAQFAALEADVIERLAASDPRVALRFGVTPSKTTLDRIGTEGVLAEDAKTALRGASVDLFAFSTRARTLATAEKELASWKPPLPDVAPPGSVLARPRLERELVARAILEERARDDEESPLDDAAGALVRGVVTTWSPGGGAWEWRERDEWVARRLLDIGASFKAGKPRATPSDLEPALFDLEKLLVPMQFPRGVAAITSLHAAMDADERPALLAMPPELLAKRMRVHLGLTAPLPEIAAALEAARARVAAAIPAETTATMADPNARAPIEQRARELLFNSARCPAVAASPVRSAAPPPERAPICAALQAVVTAFGPGDARTAALIAVHDMLVVATWTIAPPPQRTRIATLSFRADEEIADRMRQAAAARPLEVLGAALAIEIAVASLADAPRLATAWLALRDVPIDVARRELSELLRAPTSSAPPPASPRP